MRRDYPDKEILLNIIEKRKERRRILKLKVLKNLRHKSPQSPSVRHFISKGTLLILSFKKKEEKKVFLYKYQRRECLKVTEKCSGRKLQIEKVESRNFHEIKYCRIRWTSAKLRFNSTRVGELIVKLFFSDAIKVGRCTLGRCSRNSFYTKLPRGFCVIRFI